MNKRDAKKLHIGNQVMVRLRQMDAEDAVWVPAIVLNGPRDKLYALDHSKCCLWFDLKVLGGERLKDIPHHNMKPI